MPREYKLTDVDGVLCVAWTGPDYNEPRLITSAFPTTKKTMDWLLSFYEATEIQDATDRQALLDAFMVKQSMPGEYWVDSVKSWQRGSYISLVNGGQTKPVATTFTPLKPPKRAVSAEWESGRWYVRYRKDSSRKAVDPMVD